MRCKIFLHIRYLVCRYYLLIFSFYKSRLETFRGLYHHVAARRNSCNVSHLAFSQPPPCVAYLMVTFFLRRNLRVTRSYRTLDGDRPQKKHKWVENGLLLAMPEQVNCRFKTPRGDLCDQYRKKALEIHRVTEFSGERKTSRFCPVKQFLLYHQCRTKKHVSPKWDLNFRPSVYWQLLDAQPAGSSSVPRAVVSKHFTRHVHVWYRSC